MTGALAAGLEIVPELGKGPSVAAQRSVEARAVFDGPPGTVEVRVGDRWVPVARGASPLRLGRVAPDDAFRLVRGDEVVLAEPGLAWSAADVAAWSGDGLRGVFVSGMAPVGGLWVSTYGGGLARWDGTAWAHLDRRHGVPEHIWSLSVADRTRWLAGPEGVLRIAPDGRMLRLTDLGKPVWDVLALDADHAWAVTGDAVLRLEMEGDHIVPTEVARGNDCKRLVRADDVVVAGCETPLRLDGPAPVVASHLPAGLKGLVRRVDGWWTAGKAGLVAVVEDGQVPHGVLGGVEANALARMGNGMIVAAGLQGLWHVTPDRAVRIPPAAGFPSDAQALRVVEGPVPGKAWVGTTRGVVLVNEAHTATPLPLAPVAAGLSVQAVHDFGRRGAAVATEAGLAWVGPKPLKGFDSLKAAVAEPVMALASTGKDLWVLTMWHVLHLDPSGTVTRWDYGALGRRVEDHPHAESYGAHGRALAASAGRVVVGTSKGLHWWAPGAKLLGPALPVDPRSEPGSSGRGIEKPPEEPQRLAFGPDGALWIVTATSVVRQAPSGKVEVWTPGGGVKAIAPTGPGAVVATDAGLEWLAVGDPAVRALWPDVATGPVRSVALSDGHVWAVGADGTVWRDAERIRTLDEPGTVVAAPGGVWVTTAYGLWRLAL